MSDFCLTYKTQITRGFDGDPLPLAKVPLFETADVVDVAISKVELCQEACKVIAKQKTSAAREADSI